MRLQIVVYTDEMDEAIESVDDLMLLVGYALIGKGMEYVDLLQSESIRQDGR